MKTLLILINLLAITWQTGQYEIFISKVNLVDSKYPLKKIDVLPGFIGLNAKDFSVTYTEEGKQYVQPFPYLNALDDDGNFIDEADTVV